MSRGEAEAQVAAAVAERQASEEARRFSEEARRSSDARLRMLRNVKVVDLEIAGDGENPALEAGPVLRADSEDVLLSEESGAGVSSRDRIDAARREGAALVWIPDKSDQTKGIAGDNYKAAKVMEPEFLVSGFVVFVVVGGLGGAHVTDGAISAVARAAKS